MKKKLTVIFLVIFLFATSSVIAEQASLNINDTNIKPDTKIETNDEFIYQGKIMKDGMSSFEVMQETVAIPQDLLDGLEGKGIIEVGNTIRVGGIIRNRIRIAQEIKLISLTQAQRNTDNLKELTNTIKVFFSDLQNRF